MRVQGLDRKYEAIRKVALPVGPLAGGTYLRVAQRWQIAALTQIVAAVAAFLNTHMLMHDESNIAYIHYAQKPGSMRAVEEHREHNHVRTDLLSSKFSYWPTWQMGLQPSVTFFFGLTSGKSIRV